jgi:hypothetical protein
MTKNGNIKILTVHLEGHYKIFKQRKSSIEKGCEVDGGWREATS